MKINWPKWKWLMILAVVVPILGMALRFVDSLYFDVDPINDVHYSYLTMNSILLWIVIMLQLDLYYRKDVK